MINKLIVALLCLILSTLCTVWVQMQGWGLQPHSWAVIIWGMVLQFVLIGFMHAGSSDNG